MLIGVLILVVVGLYGVYGFVDVEMIGSVVLFQDGFIVVVLVFVFGFVLIYVLMMLLK